MKSSLNKLRRFALNKEDDKEKRNALPCAKMDELVEAVKDMQEMRNCYDSLLNAAAATANSAYEFSESLRDMGSCLLEKTALHDDEESGRLLLMLGQAQFELQKLVDHYRSHIVMTITNPSESLLNELRTVEDMKRQCDEKRNVYEYMKAQKEKGRSKGGKGETFTSQQLLAAQTEYDEEATLCVFRLKSLKQGQSRSLLTQAARHHAAQLNFFQKGLKSLEAIEPHVSKVTGHQHIDYHFSGLENDQEIDDDETCDGSDINEERELSFEYRVNKLGVDAVSMSRNSMEVYVDRSGEPRASSVAHRVISHSAPLFPERRSDPDEKIQMRPSKSRNYDTYVLPVPADSKRSISMKRNDPAPHARPKNVTKQTQHNWHSSPLEHKQEKNPGDPHLSEITTMKAPTLLKESNSYKASTQLPPPLAEGLSSPPLDASIASELNKTKRQLGPLTARLSSKNLDYEFLHSASGVGSRLPVPQSSSSPKMSPLTSPRINELHELPRPPNSADSAKTAYTRGLMRHSAPLVSRNSISSKEASPLPTPPTVVPRSFSIPSSHQRPLGIDVPSRSEPPKLPRPASPPLTPISLVP